MNRTRIVAVSIAFSFLQAATGLAAVAPAPARSPGSNPWSQIMYGSRGDLLGARGRDGGHELLKIDLELEKSSRGLVAFTHYSREDDEVVIRRSFEGPGSLEIRYDAGPKAMSLRANGTSANGELLLVYSLADGETFNIWTDRAGNILDGDASGLKAALADRSAVPELFHRYEKDRRPLRSHLPAVGDEILLLPDRHDCGADGAEFCTVECSWECANAACALCRAVCKAGHRIACGS